MKLKNPQRRCGSILVIARFKNILKIPNRLQQLSLKKTGPPVRTNVSWSLEKDCNILAHPQISQLADQFEPQCLDTDEDTLIFMQLHIS